MSEQLRVAAIQMNSAADKAANLAVADRLVRSACDDGAKLVLLPEKFNLLGSADEYRAGAEPLDGLTIEWAAAIAREYAIDLIAGSIVERVDGREKLANTCVHLGPNGDIVATYRKIHMFDVEVGETVYRESETEDRGDEIVLSHLSDGLQVGLTVCYDLRFPELYRILAVRGARILTVPAAFTYVTGEAHWELLLRARAIENQSFVIAANQAGFHGDGRRSFGHSMVVDAWGRVLGNAGDALEAIVVADLDFDDQLEIRNRIPSLANRVPEAYIW